jgi:hypothetical protein
MVGVPRSRGCSQCICRRIKVSSEIEALYVALHPGIICQMEKARVSRELRWFTVR